MMRILIVDDERIVLNGIRRIIENELDLPFPVDIVVAVNVPQAIELLNSFEPDLLLTDIRMPVMNGFDLIRHVRERGFDTSVAILSSHADFEYVQQAIRLNIMDYILKPIDQEILKSTILKAYEKKQEKEQGRLQSVLVEMRNMLIYDLSAQELISEPGLIRRIFPHIYFTVVVLEISSVQEDHPEILQKILLQYYGSCYCFLLQERNRIVAICNHERFNIQPKKLAEDFTNATHCKEVSAGISISASSYKTLHSLYINAIQRIFYTRYFGKNSDLTEISQLTYQDCEKIFQENDDNKVMELLQEYLAKIEASFETADTAGIYRSFIHNIMLYLDNYYIHVSNELLNGPSRSANYQELAYELMDHIRLLKSNIRNNYSNKDSYVKEKVAKDLLTYIQQHYQEDISLDDLARDIGYHPNYVCTVFKKTIGQSYLTCLHKERLYVAKRLLQETEYTMEQIANQVGYSSASQLARVFRKYEGISPSVFRNERG